LAYKWCYASEFELAWIYACGAEHLRNKEVAWKWLVIGEARWGEQDELELPSGSVQEMCAALKQSLPKQLRQRAIDKAKILAHREFVEGK
jgi:hypothetical protein